MLEESSIEDAKKRGNRVQLRMIFFFWPLFGLCLGIFSPLMVLAKLQLALLVFIFLFLIFYIILVISKFINVSWYMFSSMNLSVLITISQLVGVSYFLVNHYQVADNVDLALNWSPFWGWAVMLLVLFSFMFVFIKNFLQINIQKLRRGLENKRDIDRKHLLFAISNQRFLNGIYDKNKKILPEWKMEILDKIFRALSCIIYIAYYVGPILPFILRGVWKNQPLSLLALICSLFFAFMAGCLVQNFYAYYKVCREVENEIGHPLKPMVRVSW